VEVPPGTPLVADKGHDSDALRDDIEKAGCIPVIPHRKNRVNRVVMTDVACAGIGIGG